MTYALARVVASMRVEDYYPQSKRWWVRLHEKGREAPRNAGCSSQESLYWRLVQDITETAIHPDHGRDRCSIT
jgi:hypothetical protein